MNMYEYACTYVCMYGWMDGWMDGCKSVEVYVYTGIRQYIIMYLSHAMQHNM